MNLQKCKLCEKLVNAKVQRMKKRNHKIKCKVVTQNSDSDIEEQLPKKSTHNIPVPSTSASLSSLPPSLAPLV